MEVNVGKYSIHGASGEVNPGEIHWKIWDNGLYR